MLSSNSVPDPGALQIVNLPPISLARSLSHSAQSKMAWERLVTNDLVTLSAGFRCDAPKPPPQATGARPPGPP